MTPQSPVKQAPWDLTQFSQLPSAALLYFPESHQWSEISASSKVILVLGKASSCRAPNLGCKGAESPGWFDISPKISAWGVRREAWAGLSSWWSCQSPVAHNCSLLNHPNSFRRGMFKLNSKIWCRFIALNVTATQDTCSLNSVYHPHWPVQWSRHCSHMHVPVHSPWLPD